MGSHAHDSKGPLRVGDILFGFCGGAFGRDAYADKRVEAIGADWVVARSIDTGCVWFCDHPPQWVEEYRERQLD